MQVYPVIILYYDFQILSFIVYLIICLYFKINK